MSKTSSPATVRASASTPNADSVAVTLNEEEMAKAHELARTIDLRSPDAAPSFGRAISQDASRLTDDLLQKIRSNDRDVIGDQLNQIVQLARETHSQMAFEQKSWGQRALRSAQTIPVVGPLVRRVARKSMELHDGFRSAAEQIDNVIHELDASVEALKHTNVVFNEMYAEVTEHIRLLQIHIEAGRIALQDAQARADALQSRTDRTELETQELVDLTAAIASLEKRIADLRVLQQSALQALTNIRMIQANNVQLVEKFQTIQEVTIPAWKQGFVIRGALTQQQHAVHLTKAIDDTTNQLLLDNARLLRTNSVETARANQRLVIDVDTLQKTSDAIYETAQEVMRIRSEGKAAHETALRQLEQLQRRSTDLLTGQSKPPARLH